MSRRDKEAEEKRFIADMLCHAIEEAKYKNVLTRHQANIWYRRFGNILNMPDLLPQTVEKQTDHLGNEVLVTVPGKTLKERAKERLACGFYKPVKLPDATEKQPAKMRLIDRFRKPKQEAAA